MSASRIHRVHAGCLVAWLALAGCGGLLDSKDRDGGARDDAALDDHDGAVALGDGAAAADALAPPDMALYLAPCSTSETSDLWGLTRQCKAELSDKYYCFMGLECDGGIEPVADLYNMFGLTPWYGSYLGPVINDGGHITVSDRALDIFGAHWHLGYEMGYEGLRQEACFESSAKYIALRFIPNSSGWITMASDDTYLTASDYSLSTEPGLFDATNPKVLYYSGRGLNLRLDTEPSGFIQVQRGQVYYINFTARLKQPEANDANCPTGLGATFGWGNGLAK